MKTTDPTDLHALLVAAGCEIDSHESDLYVRDTGPAVRTISDYRKANDVPLHYEVFKSTDGQAWIDLPGMFTPWWEKRLKR